MATKTKATQKKTAKTTKTTKSGKATKKAAPKPSTKPTKPAAKLAAKPAAKLAAKPASKPAAIAVPKPVPPSSPPPPPAPSAAVPFLFVNHGRLLIESFTKAADAYIGFERAPTPAQIETIIGGCPAPLRGFASCTDTMFAIESHGDTFDWSMLEHYGTEADKMASQQSGYAEFGRDSGDRFADDVERWALAVHALVPIRFLVGPCASDEGDAWDAWSCDHLAEVLVPFLEDYVKRNASRIPEDEPTPADEGAGPFTRDAIACLLQNLEPGHAVRVSGELAPRVAKLRKAFPI